MTINENYWGMAAQIIPVIMLALVVEGRFVARQMSDEKAFANNQTSRIIYAAIFTVNTALLLASFLLAIVGASGVDVAGFGEVIIGTSLFIGVVTVFMTPTTSIISALAGDKLTEMHRKKFYSRVARAERERRRAREALAELRHEFNDAVHRAKMTIAEIYIHLGRAERGDAAAVTWLQESNLTRESADALISKLNEAIRSTKETLMQVERANAMRGELISEDEREALRAGLAALSS